MGRIKELSSFLIGSFLIVALFCLSSVSVASEKSDYPNKSIKCIVMWPAGGGGDTATRTYTKYLEKVLGQKIIIENMPGGGGSIGYMAAKTAKPDGYSLVLIQGDLPRYKLINMPIDLGDFDIIGGFAYQSPIIIAQSKAPWKTAKDFADEAKSKPGKLTIGVSDIGGLHHQPVILWMKSARFNAKAIAHAGSPQMNAAILGGHVDIVCSYVRPAIPYVKEGTLKFLGYFGPEKLQDYPNVPTFKDLGYDITWESPYGIGGPKGLPDNVKLVLARANKKVWEIPEFKQDLEKLGLSIYQYDGSSFRQRMVRMQKDLSSILQILKDQPK
jgi:tripartite-type tricarboxylate transporter receptor subunit TctC